MKYFIWLLVVFTITGCKSTSINNLDIGYVKLSFDINESGEATNIKVIEAKPEQVFNKAAVRALSKWKYKPKIVDGVATYQKDLTVQLDFERDK